MMKQLAAACAATVALALLISSTAAAPPSLRDDAMIHSELLAVAVGDALRKRCPTISARMLTVMSRAKALETYAMSQGFSEDEIDAYLDSKPDQERFKKLRDAWLAERGAIKGDSESYCRIGKAEIAAKSPIGLLLWSR